MFNLILVVETKGLTKKKKTQMKRRSGGSDNSDVTYIKKLLKHYFPEIEAKNVKYVTMDGKANCNHDKVKTEIKTSITDFKNVNENQTHVVYILDKDKNYSSPQQAAENDKIEQYLNSMSYELAWFAPDIEHVLLGRSSRDKTMDAVRFEVEDASLKANINKPIVSNTGSNFIYVVNNIVKSHK